MKLDTLLKDLPEYKRYGKGNPQIKGITQDSRKVKKGFIFVAISGLTVDGNVYIPDAIKNGASVIVGENELSSEATPVIYIKVQSSRKSLGLIASNFYGNPSGKLKVIGVTGTDGKTTTSSIIYHILNLSGHKTGLISTISARIGKKEVDTGFHVTSPDPVSLYKFLSEMVKEKCEFAVVEVTSHALEQGRVEGVTIDSAVLTNITHEHLDYHKSFQSYREVKSRLFGYATNFVVLNKDDESFNFISSRVGSNVKKYSYSLSPSTEAIYAKNPNETNNGMAFDLVSGETVIIHTSLIGKYNISNILAAISTALGYNITFSDIRKAIQSFKSPVGRLEEIKNSKGMVIYVDFAHTPNALQSVLTALRNKVMLNKRLIVVFGCAGERDVQKRPKMGRIAVSLADVSVITAEDPRGENVQTIIDEVADGAKAYGVEISSLSKTSFIDRKKMKTEHCYYKIPERGKAIAFAIQKLAKPGDTIVICGKGHEKSMAYGKVEYPWSDQEAVKVALGGGIKLIKHE